MNSQSIAAWALQAALQASIRLSSELIIRTHKQRIMNKREPRLRSNHWWRASL
jgi:hypothetical protein